MWKRRTTRGWERGMARGRINRRGDGDGWRLPGWGFFREGACLPLRDAEAAGGWGSRVRDRAIGIPPRPPVGSRGVALADERGRRTRTDRDRLAGDVGVGLAWLALGWTGEPQRARAPSCAFRPPWAPPRGMAGGSVSAFAAALRRVVMDAARHTGVLSWRVRGYGRRLLLPYRTLSTHRDMWREILLL